MPQTFFHFFERAMANGGRSTALKPLGWLLGLLIFGLLWAPRAGLPLWIIVTFTIFMALATLLYLGAYIYFMCKSPDALRSETFAIQKLAIENRLVGDSAKGIMSADDRPPVMIESRPQLQDTEEAP